MTVRLIGLARPPRPSPLQAGPRGLVTGVVSRVGVTILSCSCRTRSESFRRDPLSSRARDFLAVHLDLAVLLPKEPPHRSTPLSRSSRSFHRSPEGARRASPGVIARPSRFVVACATRQDHSTTGPYDAYQPTLTQPLVHLAASLRPARFASPGSARVVDLPALFHAGSSLGTLPSEVSPRSSLHDPLGSRRPPCRSPPCGVAAPRI